MAATTQVQILVWTSLPGAVAFCLGAPRCLPTEAVKSCANHAAIQPQHWSVACHRPAERPSSLARYVQKTYTHWAFCTQGPHRLVVRTSRRGRDNPGSNSGVDSSQQCKCDLPSVWPARVQGACLQSTMSAQPPSPLRAATCSGHFGLGPALGLGPGVTEETQVSAMCRRKQRAPAHGVMRHPCPMPHVHIV